MILILLTFLTLLFIAVNLYLTKYDYMHPSVIFCSVFFICEVMCIIFKNTYAITLHWQTLLVLCTGFLIFTIITYLFKPSYQSENATPPQQIKYINIPQIFIILLIALQVLTILSFCNYLKDIFYTYTGNTNNNLSELIRNFNDLIKFNREILINLNIHKPLLYRFGYPITLFFGLIVTYTLVNNFIALKKIEILKIISLINVCILLSFHGSRFDIFQIIIFILILYYILSVRNGLIKKGNPKFFLKLIFTVSIISSIMFGLLFLIGRGNTIGNIFNYLFIYVGAQIVNLDIFLTHNNIDYFWGLSDFFGQYTFIATYEYFNKILNIPTLRYDNVDFFISSDNGLFLGNVYTTYYQFIYDFGYIGVFLILIISLYYVFSYNNCIVKKFQNLTIDYELFILSYFFANLIFLFFTNTFFNILSPLSIKMFVMLIILYLFDKKSQKLLSLKICKNIFNKSF